MYGLLALADSSVESGLSHGEKLAIGGVFAGLAFFWILMMAVAIGLFVFWVMMLVDAVQRKEAEYKKLGNGERNLWIILLCASLFFGFYWLVAILYYLLIKRNFKK